MTVRRPQGQFDAVFFDAGQTLVRVEPSVGEVYASVAARHGVQASAKGLEAAFRRLWPRLRGTFTDTGGYRTSEAEERAWWQSLVEAVFTDVDLHPAFGGRFEAYFDEVFEAFAWPEVWHVFDDVFPALDELRQRGLRTGVISNWDHRLHVLLERLNLKPRFEFVLASAEVGRRKPHPEIFREALRRMDVPANRALHIGDSREEDVLGAQEAGMTPLLLDRSQAETTRDCLATLGDLGAWMSQYGA